MRVRSFFSVKMEKNRSKMYSQRQAHLKSANKDADSKENSRFLKNELLHLGRKEKSILKIKAHTATLNA